MNWITIVAIFVGLGLLGAIGVTYYMDSLSAPGPDIPAPANTGDVQEVTLGFGNNYEPNIITVNQGVPVRITMDMNEVRGCFRSVVIPQLGIRKTFTESDNVLEFTPDKKGTYPFSCAMGMGTGKIVVV
ncbi:cupredoxin domain-containing protein [Candidatus Woesearchaeota archaeon]|nr:cupredoxin domain-containing protein [Candidatus Woesearchaeota archaeon]